MKGSFFMGADKTPRFQVKEMEFGPLGEHEVLVQNKACGVCGTDVHIYHGEKGSADVIPPVVLGHEYAGIVAAVGSGVTDVKPGDHVAMDPNMYCGKCMPCRMGRKQNCEHLFALGVNVNGGFAEYSVCPDTQCFKVNKDISFNVAAMAEPLACVIHGIDLVHIQPGQTVLVIGGGTIGLMMVQMAKLVGASCVILSEPIEMRRKIGLEVGADAAIDPIHENLKERILEISGRDGADVVIECVGRPMTAAQAVDAAGFNANVLLFGVPGVEDTLALPMFKVYQKELHITGSMINPDTHQRAVNLINSGRIELEKLITHIYDLDHLEDAIKMQMSSESIKVLVNP
ncbi:MAG: zinc-dependent alcohol dehydrogenase family protein [Eubacteriales bacterium]|nr:zinc-dependent alcohol dehydrogenase family protein [Eubacteriales bacterium]